ncbi:MAG TPA: ABC transporter permease [bacterium]|jgi:phospholipid/cholesterol/gamma-HCH transport system permease protein|nr:ABC transporter permease [bacterium]HNZ54834.1 ABC transporter permease [bacterium]HOG44485.1 ABC transporter permease [bacterium]HPY15501.1 ABC transporter permease [bacterium]
MEKIKIPGDLTIENSEKAYLEISASISKLDSVTIDVADITLNSMTKALIRKLSEEFGEKLVIDEDVRKEIFYQKEESEEEKNPRKKEPFLERFGETLIKTWEIIYYFCVIMVDMLFYSFESLYNRKFVLKDDATKNAYYIGYKAIPIVSLLAFLIGLTIALQAAIQLAKMGGQGYIAMMSTMVMTKELGPLITAIIIAGRTGSSIAAEIGTMVVMEEVDALKTMGIKPLKFLLVPKFWAFTLVMPILTLIADIAGIFGGFLVASVYSIPAGAFVNQMIESLEFADIFWGTIKSISFAWVILAVGSFKGLNVRGGADAVGRATTESVVVSIFLVVAIDAIFSLILYT